MERQRYLNHCLEAELNDKEMNFFGVFYLYQVLVLLIPSPISDQKGDLLWFALGLVEVRRLNPQRRSSRFWAAGEGVISYFLVAALPPRRIRKPKQRPRGRVLS